MSRSIGCMFPSLCRCSERADFFHARTVDRRRNSVLIEKICGISVLLTSGVEHAYASGGQKKPKTIPFPHRFTTDFRMGGDQMFGLGEGGQNFFGMLSRFYFWPDFFDPALRADQEGDPVGSLILHAHELLFAPDAVRLNDAFVGIGD